MFYFIHKIIIKVFIGFNIFTIFSSYISSSITKWKHIFCALGALRHAVESLWTSIILRHPAYCKKKRKKKVFDIWQTKVNYGCEYVESVKKAREGGKMYMCENRVESWQCPGVYSKLRICANSFNKRANPRHSKTDREGKKERESRWRRSTVCLLHSTASHKSSRNSTQHTQHSSGRLCYSLLSPCDSLFIFGWRFLSYLSPSLWSSVFLTLFLSMLFCSAFSPH